VYVPADRWGDLHAALAQDGLLALCALGLCFIESAPAQTIHIVAFGDSSTQGPLVAPKDTYPAQLQAALRAKGHDVQVHNAGLVGDTTATALRRFDAAIPRMSNIAIVELGINDLRFARVPMNTIEENISRIVRTLQARRIQVLVVGIEELDLSAMAKAIDVPYVQHTLPPDRYRASDGEHLNAEGYAIMVERILPSVEALIARVRAARR
jgi:acyl-CoA thioesterase-1